MSEFGSGIVVCLAKFSEHLWNPTDPSNGPTLRTGLPYSERVEVWANGASDHFYELDRERAPAPLIELADLTLEMGHGFTGKTWAEEDMERVRRLWKESCLAVDKMLGLEAEWGEW